MVIVCLLGLIYSASIASPSTLTVHVAVLAMLPWVVAVMTVLPIFRGVIIPVADTVAMEVLLLVH